MVKTEIRFYNKHFVKLNSAKYNLSYKSHIGKIKTMTLTSTNTHLKVPRRHRT